MKKTQTLLLAFILFFLSNEINAQKYTVFTRQLEPEVLSHLKSALNKHSIKLDSMSVLLINYIQPLSYCHYSKYEIRPKKNREVEIIEFYKKKNIQLDENSRFINLFFEASLNSRFTAEYNYYHDENQFIHNLINYISPSETCECYIALNRQGKMMIKYGEVDLDEIRSFVKEVAITP